LEGVPLLFVSICGLTFPIVQYCIVLSAKTELMFVVNISFAFSFAMFDYSMRKKIKITFVDGTLFVLNDFKAYNIP
jgi:hypothetical protein